MMNILRSLENAIIAMEYCCTQVSPAKPSEEFLDDIVTVRIIIQSFEMVAGLLQSADKIKTLDTIIHSLNINHRL